MEYGKFKFYRIDTHGGHEFVNAENDKQARQVVLDYLQKEVELPLDEAEEEIVRVVELDPTDVIKDYCAGPDEKSERTASEWAASEDKPCIVLTSNY